MLNMFIQNKYTKTYFKIINLAVARETPLPHSEAHHIIPKSLGGTNDFSNVVHLTPREHYVVHRLLTKMVEGIDKSKMTFALHTFFYFNKHRQLNFTSRQYEHHREELKKACKYRKVHTKLEIFKFRHKDTGAEFKGTRREFINFSKLTEQECNFLFRAASNPSLPTRWIKGWGVWVDQLGDWSYNKKIKVRVKKKYVCPHCNKQTTKVNMIRWHGNNCKTIDPQGHYERSRKVSELYKRR